jgi:hypothetical protein
MCFREEFQNVKASIKLKQVCQPAKAFTQSFVAYSFYSQGVCRKFLRRIGP